MKRHLQSNTGGVLVLVLLVMMTMTILGATLLSVSLSDNKQSILENNRLEAYYLARSGVEATAAWILSAETTSQDINKIIDKKSEESSLGKGTFFVEVSKDPINDDLVLKGTGVVNGVSSSTRMLLEKSSGLNDDLKFDYSIYAGDILLFSGNSWTNGEVGYGGEGEPTLNGNKAESLREHIEKIFINYPIPKIPEPDAVESTMEPHNIVFDDKINTIEFSNGIIFPSDTKRDLIINTESAVGDVNIIVRGNFEFDVQKEYGLHIVGDNRVNIYVTGNVVYNKGDINSGGSPHQLLFLMDSTGSFAYNTNANQGSFNGFIYAPKAKFILGGNSSFKGAIIAQETTLHGTPFVDGYVFNPDEDNIVIPNQQLYSKGTWLE